MKQYVSPSIKEAKKEETKKKEKKDKKSNVSLKDYGLTESAKVIME